MFLKTKDVGCQMWHRHT